MSCFLFFPLPSLLATSRFAALIFALHLCYAIVRYTTPYDHGKSAECRLIGRRMRTRCC